MHRRDVPGVCVAAIDDGQVAWTRSLGDVETTTVFEAASLSKPVFAAGVLRMAERDILHLDASLAPLLPEPPIPDPRVNRITARMVLCHMSGFPNGRDRPDEQPGLLRDPGIEFGYSGEGYFYLQRAIQGLSPSRTFAEVMQEEVFSPLGLVDTSFVWLERYEHRFATGHDDRGHEFDKQRIDQGHAAQTLHTTAPEFAALMCAVLMSGRLLQPQTVAEMLRPHVEVHEDWGCGPPDSTFWGLGWGLTDTVGGGMSAWQWGWNAGFRHFAIAWPERHAGLVILTNSDLGLWVCKAAVTAASGMEHPAFRWLEH